MCPCCGIKLISPEWSERINADQTVNFWSCVICGKEFRTTDNIIDQTMDSDELAEEFLPNRLVVPPENHIRA